MWPFDLFDGDNNEDKALKNSDRKTPRVKDVAEAVNAIKNSNATVQYRNAELMARAKETQKKNEDK